MKAISWKRLKDESLNLYDAKKQAATRQKVAQILDELIQVGAKTSRDLDARTIALWCHAHSDRRPATNASLLRTLRPLVKYAMIQGYLRANPFHFRSPEKWARADRDEPEPIDRHLSPAELCRVLNQADAQAVDWKGQRLRALVYTLAYTGARKREILGLLSADVDCAEGLIEIRPNPRRPLKSRRSAATLAIPGQLAMVLSPWRITAGSVWLFPNSQRSGPWMSGRPGHRAYDQLVKLGNNASVPGLCFDSFRDTVATLAEPLGLGELELQRQLRHADKHTQKRYRKQELANLRGIAKKLDHLRELA